MFPGISLPPRASSTPPVEQMEDESIETPMHEDMEAASVNIMPDAVSYRNADMVCGNCRYMEASGECQPLKMTVEPGDGCNLFVDRGAM